MTGNDIIFTLNTEYEKKPYQRISVAAGEWMEVEGRGFKRGMAKGEMGAGREMGDMGEREEIGEVGDIGDVKGEQVRR